MTLPVISLWQPWASLCFTGQKRHETRSFRLPSRLIGKPVGIHATAKFPAGMIGFELHRLCLDTFGEEYWRRLPQGAILGTVRFDEPVSSDLAPWLSNADFVSGDWEPGRFGWPIRDYLGYVLPIPAKGQQGFWRYDA